VMLQIVVETAGTASTSNFLVREISLDAAAAAVRLSCQSVGDDRSITTYKQVERAFRRGTVGNRRVARSPVKTPSGQYDPANTDARSPPYEIYIG